MTQQYIRACSLIVGNASGQGLDLSALRIEFTVNHASAQTPKILVARISNVAAATAALVKAEFTRVILSAGYTGALGKIFDGEIRQTRYGRESPTDTYLDIIAADGDQAYSQAFSNQTLAAGHTSDDIFKAVSQTMQAYGVTAGTAPPASPQASASAIRPKVMFGPSRDILRTLATSTGTSFSITDAQLNFALLDAPQVPGQQAVVLSSQTGLIGIPRQTIDGVEATCLLNPQLKANGFVTIATTLIAQAQVDQSFAATQGGNLTGTGSNQSVAGLSPSGTYRIVYIDHTGDTRGDPWHSTVSCFADDGNAVQGSANLIAVP